MIPHCRIHPATRMRRIDERGGYRCPRMEPSGLQCRWMEMMFDSEQVDECPRCTGCGMRLTITEAGNHQSKCNRCAHRGKPRPKGMHGRYLARQAKKAEKA